MTADCEVSCFECPYRDCIFDHGGIATPWEKEFNSRQRKIKREKKRAAKKENGAKGHCYLAAFSK